jgi:hypothetical protein
MIDSVNCVSVQMFDRQRADLGAPRHGAPGQASKGGEAS